MSLWDLSNKRPLCLPASEVCALPPKDMLLRSLHADLARSRDRGAELTYQCKDGDRDDKTSQVALRTLAQTQPGDKVLVALGTREYLSLCRVMDLCSARTPSKARPRP